MPNRLEALRCKHAMHVIVALSGGGCMQNTRFVNYGAAMTLKLFLPHAFFVATRRAPSSEATLGCRCAADDCMIPRYVVRCPTSAKAQFDGLIDMRK